MSGVIAPTFWTPDSGSTTRLSPIGYAGASGFQDAAVRNQQIGNGTAGAPSLAFAAETAMGIFRSGAGVMAIAANGGAGVTFDFNNQKLYLNTSIPTLSGQDIAGGAGSLTLKGGDSSNAATSGGVLYLIGGRAGAGGSEGPIFFRTAGTDRLELTGTGGLSFKGTATGAVSTSAANTGTIIYDSTLNAFYVSANGAAYAQIQTGSGPWTRTGTTVGLTNAGDLVSLQNAGGSRLDIANNVGPGLRMSGHTAIGWQAAGAPVGLAGNSWQYISNESSHVSLILANQQVRFSADTQLTWSNTTLDPQTATDIGIGRNAAGIAKISNGSTGGGSLALSGLTLGATTTILTPTAGQIGWNTGLALSSHIIGPADTVLGINAGTRTTAGSGMQLSLFAGPALTSGTGGIAYMLGGDGAGTGAGGQARVRGGGGGSSGNGGAVSLEGGTAGTGAFGGNITLTGGTGASGGGGGAINGTGGTGTSAGNGNGGGITWTGGAGVGTNQQGGGVYLISGTSTGTALPGPIVLRSKYNSITGGTSSNSTTDDRVYVASKKLILTSGVDYQLAAQATSSNTVYSFTIFYLVRCQDASDHQVETGWFNVIAINDAGVLTVAAASPAKYGNGQQTTGGTTLTVTPKSSASGTNLLALINAVTDIAAPTTFDCEIMVFSNTPALALSIT